jgi:hypothetical protein
MHYLSLIYYTTQSQHVSSTFIAHQQEVFAVHVQQLVCVTGDWQLVGSGAILT